MSSVDCFQQSYQVNIIKRLFIYDVYAFCANFEMTTDHVTKFAIYVIRFLHIYKVDSWVNYERKPLNKKLRKVCS